MCTTTFNKIKQDPILKNFWRNNDRFADLFNAALFGGRAFLHPEDLTEADTDVSSLLKFNGHAETIQKVFDVVKKTAYGIDFVVWGLENQSKIHYAMPLRHTYCFITSLLQPSFAMSALLSKKPPIAIFPD